MDYFTTTQLNFPKIENPFEYDLLYQEQLPSENFILEVPPLTSFYEPKLPPLSHHYDQLTNFQDFEDFIGGFYFDNTIYCEEDTMVDEKPKNNYVTSFDHHVFKSDICTKVTTRVSEISEIYANLDKRVKEGYSISRPLKGKKCVYLELSDIQKYFDVPIREAAKELGIGVTRLKKRCRELGILRWPHRKIKSLEYLISNVKKMGANSGEIVMLQEQKRLIEKAPNLELTSKAKKLRQACFKANYKNKMSLAIGRHV